MPPIKNIFDDNPDLAVTSFATQPWEGEKVKFTYTIKNVGDVNIVNPKGYISYAGNKLSVSFKGVSEPGESASGELVARSPQVSKDEKYTATIFMNPDENNPKFEPMGNNKKTIELTVKNIERDLYVDSIRIEGNTYFDGNLDKLAKLFEGEEVYFEYKLGFYSNKPDEKMVNPVVFYGKEGGKQKEEQITKTIKAGEKTGWIKPTFKYQNH